jgi:hypothetical protein
MSGAYIEILPPDRPIFMLGQPIIKLVASGGPGGDLGDMAEEPPVNWDIQRMLTQASEGGAPDVSSEYFKPKNIPGLAPGSEGPHTGREGIYPKKLRDMVEFDMTDMYGVGQSAFLSLSDLACAQRMDTSGGLGCCGSKDSMSDMPPGVEAKALKEKCDGLEKRIANIVKMVEDAISNKTLTVSQKRGIALQARKDIKSLRHDFRCCLKQLKSLVKAYRKTLKAEGLGGIESHVDDKIRIERCRDKIRKIREIVCKKRQQAQ